MAVRLAEVITGVQARASDIGLVASAVKPDDGDFAGGVIYRPDGYGVGGIVDPCGSTKNPAAGPGSVRWSPYGVWEADRCSTLGGDYAEAGARARRLLQANESHHIERELWTGEISNGFADPNPRLADAGVDKVTTTATDAQRALACLEGELADALKGQAGMIHAPRTVVSLWHQGGALRKEGSAVLTINDTLVVAGSGYPGSGPPAVAGDPPVAATDGHVWAYATPMVEVRRGDIVEVPDTDIIDRSVNTRIVLAERLALASYDALVTIAAEIDAPACGTS